MIIFIPVPVHVAKYLGKLNAYLATYTCTGTGMKTNFALNLAL